MMVQPLIENIIHHGIRNSQRKDLFVRVSAEQVDNTLCFIIRGNGAGLKMQENADVSGVKQKYFGIKLIKERLEIVNRSQGKNIAKFSLSDDNNAITATLTLPVLN